jgi:hypothetical protein
MRNPTRIGRFNPTYKIDSFFWAMAEVGTKPSEENKSSSCLSFGPSATLQPSAHILIRTSACALQMNQHSARFWGFIFFRQPYRTRQYLSVDMLPGNSRRCKYLPHLESKLQAKKTKKSSG